MKLVKIWLLPVRNCNNIHNDHIRAQDFGSALCFYYPSEVHELNCHPEPLLFFHENFVNQPSYYHAFIMLFKWLFVYTTDNVSFMLTHA